MKVNEKTNRYGDLLPSHDKKFIEKIREQDYWMEGPNLIEKFEKINSKINVLKTKGFRIILNHHLNNGDKSMEKIKRNLPKKKICLNQDIIKINL
mmetsp:Transcript_27434/g.24313  ORF Transcript_27434/g.24313 Transcript_27434/m.24313 type:complete len:95 (-) Transcript_27434:37-321(-)